MRQRPSRGDDGITLLIVLCFIVLVSVVATGLLTFVHASFESSGAVRTARQSGYAADSAMELAVANVAGDQSGDVGTPDNPGCSYTLTAVNGYTSTVTCAPFNSTYGAWYPNRARNALLTLSSSSDSLLLTGNNPLYVNGPVYSNGDITTAQPNNLLSTTSTVRTEGTGGECATSKVVAARGKYCAGAATVAGDDPPWTIPSTSGLTTIDPLTDTGLTCTAYNAKKVKGGIFAIPPGKYLVSPLTALALPKNKTCLDGGSTLWFKPGVFLFSGFTFTPSLSVAGNPSYEVVGGTVAGTWLANSDPPPTDGTACNKDSTGAQFVLGANALGVTGKITLEDYTPSFTLCAGPSPVNQPALAISADRSIAGTVLTTPNKPSVFVHGVVYLPGATADITLHNKAQTYYDGGVVSFKLIADVSASFAQIDAPVVLPACTSGLPCRSNRKVVFRASISGAERLTSVMDLDDGYGATPGRSTTVRQWSTVR